MIGRPPRRLRINSAKPNLGQIEFLDKGVDRSNRIVFANPVVQAFRKQRSLPAIRAFDKAPHMIPPKIAQESYRANHPIHNEIEGFHTAWVINRKAQPEHFSSAFSRESGRCRALPRSPACARLARVAQCPLTSCNSCLWAAG